MKSFALLTVMHTGTNSMKAQARDLGYDAGHHTKIRRMGRGAPNPSGVMYIGHAFKEVYERVESALLLVTLSRPYEEIEASWRRRGKSLEPLKVQYRLWRQDIRPKAIVIDLHEPARGLMALSEATGSDWGKTLNHHENKS